MVGEKRGCKREPRRLRSRHDGQTIYMERRLGEGGMLVVVGRSFFLLDLPQDSKQDGGVIIACTAFLVISIDNIPMMHYTHTLTGGHKRGVVADPPASPPIQTRATWQSQELGFGICHDSTPMGER